MSAAVLLARLDALGVTATAEAGAIRLRPARLVPADLLAEVKACKPALLALLAANDDGPHPAAPAPAMPPPDDLPDVAEIAAALAATPGQRIAETERAGEYFRAEAIRRREHARLDPAARGLLLGYLRARGVR